MAQYQITLNSEHLHELFGEGEGMARLLEQILNQVLQAQATEQLQAAPYERTEERKGYRNGTLPHPLTTRVGTLTLRVPRLRNGQFSTNLFARYQRSEQALVLALLEMVINGVSTRKITKITEELCGTEFPKSTVSDLCKRLDPIVQAWNNRTLGDRYPFILVDALVLKIREDGRVRSRSALIAVGINENGYREILGLMLGDSESKDSWTAFFKWLKGRDLRGVDIIVSDSHSGLVHAVRTQFQGATWQRCQTHFMRNILDAAPKSLQGEIYGRVRALLTAPDTKTARLLLDKMLEDYEQPKAAKAMDVLETGFDDATAILGLPERYRKRLRTTNSVERLNQEIRRRERVIRIFPNRDSVTRLLGALLMEMDEKWSTGHRYLDMTEYLHWWDEQRKARKQASKVHQLC